MNLVRKRPLPKNTMADAVQQSRFKLTSTSVPKTRLGLSLAERIKVIEARQMGKSMRQLATQFGCGKTQILNTLTQKERYIHEWEVMGRNNPSIGARKRFRHSRNEQINRSVHDWYQQQTASGLRVTGPMLQKQARHYATLLEISNFGASNGWLANFRRFYNIISSSPHPRKQNLSITFHQYHPNDKSKEGNNQATSSSNYHQHEFVTVVPEHETSDRTSSRFLKTAEVDPLVDASPQQAQEPLELTCNKIRQCRPKTTNHHLFNPIMYSIPSPNSTSPEECSGKEETIPQRDKCMSSSPTFNHRKRRLLQLHESDRIAVSPKETIQSELSNDEVQILKERRIPKLVPIMPAADYLTEFANLARAKGLLTLTVKDDCGQDWVEIRQSVAFYRVPKHGYPTHLTRLIINSSLQYFLEVLGHCIRNGSLRYHDNSYGLNYQEATSILGAVNGEYIVCAGVESISHRMAGDSNMKNVQDFGNLKNMYLTLPDNKYRSNECAKWIDYRFGPKCSKCEQAAVEFSSVPMDLRRLPSPNYK